jgi:hypothetical protein
MKMVYSRQDLEPNRISLEKNENIVRTWQYNKSAVRLGLNVLDLFRDHSMSSECIVGTTDSKSDGTHFFSKTTQIIQDLEKRRDLEMKQAKADRPLILLSILIPSSNPSTYSYCSCSYDFNVRVVYLTCFSHLDSKI